MYKCTLIMLLFAPFVNILTAEHAEGAEVLSFGLSRGTIELQPHCLKAISTYFCDLSALCGKKKQNSLGSCLITSPAGEQP